MAITAGSSIAQVLGAGLLEAVDARILLGHALNLSRVQLITRSEHCLTADEAQAVDHLFTRRQAGEPVAYLTGERGFFGLDFYVTRAVLIPRPETELLVELALERLPERGRLVDLGTGSGAIPVAIAHTRPDAEVTALDISTAALEVARKNAARYQLPINFLHSDWFSALSGQFDVIVANPPYIVAGDRHLAEGDLRFEPVDALTDHGDGLSALRSIIGGAGDFLAPGGWLLMEHGYDQAASVRELLKQQSMTEIHSWADLAGIERVTGARRKTSP